MKLQKEPTNNYCMNSFQTDLLSDYLTTVQSHKIIPNLIVALNNI